MRQRIGNWFLQLLLHHWTLLLLVFGLLLSMIVSVDEASWVRDDRAVLASVYLAMLLGWALAYSRFSGWFAALYGLVFSAGVGVQVVGKIVPPLRDFVTTPFFTLVDGMNLRLVMLQLRVDGWFGILQGGENLNDTGLFVFLLLLLIWWAVLWLMWNLIRRRRALLGMLPLGVLMAVNVNLSRQSLAHFWGFLLFVVLLMAYEAFTNQHKDWQARRVDYPESLGLEWGVGACALALVILGAARLLPIIGTPEGWRAIAEWRDQWRQRTSETAERLFAGVNTPPPPPSGEEPEVWVSTPNLGEIGAPLPQGSDVVMWVTTSDPPPLREDLSVNVPDLEVKGHYWRDSIFATYTGRGWEEAAVGEDAAAQADEAQPGQNAPDGRYYLRQNFDIVARHSGNLFSVSEPVRVDQGVQIRQTAVDGSHLLQGEVSDYQVISEATRVTGTELAQAGMYYPEAVRSTYLQLPVNLPQRVTALAERLAGGAGDPFHKAIAIQNYLRQNYPYNQSVRPPPEGRDVVDYFLFEEGEGFCSHYSSAMVVMLRSQGVPARVAAGYATGFWDTNRQAYHVTISEAHAWVEVYFPGYGWVEFEPTASQTTFIYPDSQPLPSDQTALTEETGKQARRASPLALVGLGLVVLALLALPFGLMRVFRAKGGEPGEQVNNLYRQMRQALVWAGLPATDFLTPDEYAGLCAGPLARYDRLNKALRQTTALYCQSLYSPRPPDAVGVRIANQLWQQSLNQWVVLWLRDRWRRFQQKG